MLDKLLRFQQDLADLFRSIGSERSKTVNKASLRSKAVELSKIWLDDLEPQLLQISTLDPKTIALRTKAFRHLIKVSGPSNLKTSYLRVLKEIRRGFRDELIIPIQSAPKSDHSGLFPHFVFEGLDASESVYLKEALDCAKNKYHRAAVVLGWCAAINRVHGKVEQLGFGRFNTTSENMAIQTVGRFKKFTSRQSVASISELRLVFDTTILWILEGMGLIDTATNMHDSLVASKCGITPLIRGRLPSPNTTWRHFSPI